MQQNQSVFFLKTPHNYLGALLLILFVLAPIHGWTVQRVECCSITRASAGASIATAEPTDSVFDNPATINQVKNQFFISSFVADQMTLALVDNNRDNFFPAGLFYNQKKYEDDRPLELQEEHTFGLAAGGIVVPRLQYGIAIKSEQYRIGDQRYKQIGSDIGLLFVPTVNFGVGLVRYNAISSADKEIEKEVGVSAWGVGVNYFYKQIIKLKMDFQAREELNPKGGFVEAGIESRLGTFTAFRMGYSWLVAQNELDPSPIDRKYTMGFGFLGPQFHINYAYIDEKPSNESVHSIDLAIPF